MFNPGLIKALRATANADPYTIAKHGAGVNDCTPASAAADMVVGVFTEAGATNGQAADVVITGMPGVKLGGTVTKGAKLTANATGLAVVAAAGNRIIGTAYRDGVSGDVIPVVLNIGATA